MRFIQQLWLRRPQRRSRSHPRAPSAERATTAAQRMVIMTKPVLLE
ncbi:MAG: hypothetical protein KME14_02640 [Tildeniella torsiva UHER 1998/13D]|nr:hypothetical protein [Tildeniella torsiva UHER 1998/13D]